MQTVLVTEVDQAYETNGDRASNATLNMLIRNDVIEMRLRNPEAVVIDPGTCPPSLLR